MKTPLLSNDYNLVETEIDLKEDESAKEALVETPPEKKQSNNKRTSTLKGKSVSFDSNFGNNILISNVNNANSHNHSLMSDSSFLQNNQSIKLRMLEKTNSSHSNLVYCTTNINNNGQNSFISPQSIRSVNLNGTSSALLCRICYTAENLREPLLQPCNCSGTMGLMHQKCLEKWLSQSNSNRCEICNFEFSVKKIPRSFSQWLFRPLTTKDTKNLFNDFVCFLILTPLAYISTWYCVLFALRFHEAENKWEASGLVVLTTFLLFIYILWFLFSCKYHFRVFKEWQEKNQIVTLKLSEENLKFLNCNINACPKTIQNQAQANLPSHSLVNEVFVKKDNKQVSEIQSNLIEGQSNEQQNLIQRASFELKQNESENLQVITKTSNNESLIENANKDQCLT